MNTLVRLGSVRASLVHMIAWLAGTCATSPGCKRDDAGPQVQIVSESIRLRISDPTPATSPWFDGARVSLLGARGEILGLQVVHRDGGPVALTISSEARAAPAAVNGSPGRTLGPTVQVRSYDVEAYEVHR